MTIKNREYPLIYRIIHWSVAFCMLAILFTIFLRLTWFDKDTIADIIQNYFSSVNQPLDREKALTLARQIRKPMWEWHIYFGYIMTGLYSIRMLLPVAGIMKFSNPFQQNLTIKEKFQCWVYVAFYICVAISLVTGLLIKFGPKSLEEPAEDIHVLSIYYLVTYIFLHLGGVLLAEFTDQKGIVSRIVSGGGSGSGGSSGSSGGGGGSKF